MENFNLNGKTIKAREMDFNFLCLLGERGIELQDISTKALPALRAYVSFCMGTSEDIAGNEINAHIINGGTFEDILNVFREKMEDSGFFRALGKSTTSKDTTAAPKKSAKKNAEEASE